MLKKTIKYTDYDGVERTEDFYFNLNKVEITEMEVSAEGGMVRKLERIIQDLDKKEMVDIFKDIILRAYGEKSPDGKKFVKSKELRDGFSQTEAFVELYVEITEDAEKATAFINGIVPQTPQPTTNLVPTK